MTHRFNGVPINLETLDRKEVLALNVYTHQHLGQALAEVAIMNRFMRDHGMYGPLVPVPDFEHDPFGDTPCQKQLPGFPEGA